MGAHYFNTSQSTGVVYIADIYLYKGYTFEFHKYCGPMLCKKDGEPAARQPGEKSKFWIVFDEWINLSEEEKEETRICG